MFTTCGSPQLNSSAQPSPIGLKMLQFQVWGYKMIAVRVVVSYTKYSSRPLYFFFFKIVHWSTSSMIFSHFEIWGNVWMWMTQKPWNVKAFLTIKRIRICNLYTCPNFKPQNIQVSPMWLSRTCSKTLMIWDSTTCMRSGTDLDHLKEASRAPRKNSWTQLDTRP